MKMYYIRYNDGQAFKFSTPKKWEAAIEDIAENEPYDIDVDYERGIAWVDNGDFD